MKNISKFIFTTLFFLAGTLTSYAYTIDDNYIGANPSGDTGWEKEDVIGTSDIFQIYGMNIGLTGNKLKNVEIYTEYVKPLSDIGTYGTELGDLFISTNGYASGDDLSDTWASGERWEYALVFDYHDPNSNSGNISLYKVEYGANGGQGNIMLTNDCYHSGGVFREQQETRINTAVTDALLGSIGTWTIDSTNGIITFNINDNDWLTGTDFGFHWNMTCGNDTIEGGASVPTPEPSTLLLLGGGLLGLAFYTRKRSKA